MEQIDRFLKLVSIESTSCEDSDTCPSTPSQMNVAKEIVSQLKDIGITDAEIDEHGYVYATIEANCDKQIPVYGLIAHMDTSPDASGKDIKARVTDVYDGGNIVLNEEKGIVLSPDEFPELLRHVGKHLVVTDGTTLLGADDKAGASEIIAAAELIMKSEKKHGKIRLGFTPDEEIGRGADLFDVAKFGADFAYTVDGGEIGEIEYENFNAASASITINGKSVHPGSAKNKMVNASLVAIELNALLPEYETPYYTEGYEGFFHLTDINGECEKAELHYIIRDHDMDTFMKRKTVMENAVKAVNDKYGDGTAVLTLRDSYFNMKEKIEPYMFLIEDLKTVFANNGISAECVPIRGGTDGARLSFEGLPCPNICTGGANYHGRFEYAVCEDMAKITTVLADLLWLQAEK